MTRVIYEGRIAGEFEGFNDEALFKIFLSSGSFDTASVGRFAKKLCIAHGIVVGRLQHDKAIPYSSGNSLKAHFRFAHTEDGCNE